MEKFTEDQALKWVFDNIDKNSEHYKVVKVYQDRHRKGRLGCAAKKSLLEKFGFRQEVSYRLPE